jgi:hypothetical protein
MAISQALKEWDVAVRSLAAGKTILLLRKGGIREVSSNFQVKYRTVLLYPTYEHQKPHLLKPEFAQQITPVPSGWHPETIPINCWAEITDIFSLNRETSVNLLFPYHIWTEEFVSDRLKWKANQPLYLLLLRVHNLRNPVSIFYDTSYGGCQSWINIVETIDIADSHPILDEPEYTKRKNLIFEIINHGFSEPSTLNSDQRSVNSYQ